MKNTLASFLTAIAIALGATPMASQPSAAQSRQFFCGLSYNYPATMVRHTRKSVPLIVWTENSWINDKWTPRKRCEALSDRFQDLNNKGELRVLKTGRVNGLPVICGLSSNLGSCNRSNVLLTLKGDQDPNLVLDQLLNTRGTVTGQPVYLSGNQEGRIEPEIGSDGFASVDLDAIINDGSETPSGRIW